MLNLCCPFRAHFEDYLLSAQGGATEPWYTGLSARGRHGIGTRHAVAEYSSSGQRPGIGPRHAVAAYPNPGQRPGPRHAVAAYPNPGHHPE